MIMRCAWLAAVWVGVASPGMAGAGATEVQPLPVFERVLALNSPRDIGELELTDHTGKRRRLADLAGTPALVFFGFTNCPEVCPATMRNLALLKSTKAKELDGVRVVMISVDGERDSPEAMADFLKKFSADFVGLTAPATQVRDLALRFSAPFFKDPPRDGKYLVQHSNRVYALDRQGRLRAELYDASAEAMVGVMRALLSE